MRVLFLLSLPIIIAALVFYTLGCFDWSGDRVKSGFLPKYFGFILLGIGAIFAALMGLSLATIFEMEFHFNVLFLIIPLICVGSFGYVTFNDELNDKTSTAVLYPLVFFAITVIPAFFLFI